MSGRFISLALAGLAIGAGLAYFAVTGAGGTLARKPQVGSKRRSPARRWLAVPSR